MIRAIARFFTRFFLCNEWKAVCISATRLLDNAQGHSHMEPAWLLQALLVSGEDHRFFRHQGVDMKSLCRAAWRTFVCGQREGGSTIEMQLVRVLTNRYERTFRRKLREILLAVMLPTILPKSRIPSLYIQIAYYGWHMNGLFEACNRLRLSPISQSAIDSAKLIARLKYPEPQEMSAERARKIEIRAQHLLSLYEVHFCSNRYDGFKLRTSNGTLQSI